MVYKKFSFWDWVGIYFFGIYGLFYTILPHSAHQRFEFTWLIANNTNLLEKGLPHGAHVTIGLIFIFLAINIIIMGLNKRGKKKK